MSHEALGPQFGGHQTKVETHSQHRKGVNYYSVSCSVCGRVGGQGITRNKQRAEEIAALHERQNQ